MNTIFKGILFGIISAVSYGVNPLGALFLYQEGVNTFSVLFHRFALASLILGILLLVQKQSFRITKKEFVILASLGVLFAVSSVSLFSSFHYMDVGIASTILFVYPVMVAIIMTVLFKEKISLITILSIALSLGGIALLYKGENGSTLSSIGILFVMLSSLSYAIYMVIVNKSGLTVHPVKQTFYALLFCLLTITVCSFNNPNNHIEILPSFSAWMWAGMLAVVSTIISVVTMVKAIQIIGSTSTAVLGALEPLTAVMIGTLVFGEIITAPMYIGILLILAAVILIVAGKSSGVKASIQKILFTSKPKQRQTGY